MLVPAFPLVGCIILNGFNICESCAYPFTKRGQWFHHFYDIEDQFHMVARTQTNLKNMLLCITLEEGIRAFCCLAGQDTVNFEVTIFHTYLYFVVMVNFPLLIMCPSFPLWKG